MRCLIALTLLCLMFASTAEAKLDPAFSERVAQAGDPVAIDVGEGSEQFLGPLRIYLVPLEAADRLRGEADRRLVKIGELGTPGEFGTPRVLTFEVPDLPEGEYTAAIWFRGYETGTWANAIEGAASPAGSDEAGMPLFWPIAIAGGILVAAFLGFGWRRGNRRPTSDVSAS